MGKLWAHIYFFYIKETETDSFASKVQEQYLQHKILHPFPTFPLLCVLANAMNTSNQKQFLQCLLGPHILYYKKMLEAVFLWCQVLNIGRIKHFYW